MDSTKKARYPHKISIVYLSAVTVVLSAALALMLLETPIMLLAYFATTSIITVSTFSLKSFLLTRRLEASETDATYTENTRWKTLILNFLLLIAFLLIPLFLAGLLDPYIWFISMISLTSGLSLAEILLYLQMR